MPSPDALAAALRAHAHGACAAPKPPPSSSSPSPGSTGKTSPASSSAHVTTRPAGSKRPPSTGPPWSPRWAPAPCSATGSGTCPPRRPRPPADPEDQPRLAMERRLPRLLAAALHAARTRLTSTNHPSGKKGGTIRRGRSRCAPGHPRAASRNRPRQPNRHHNRNRAATQSVSEPQAP